MKYEMNRLCMNSIAIVILLLTSGVQSQNVLLLNSGSYPTEANLDSFLGQYPTGFLSVGAEPGYHILQFEEIPGQEEKIRLALTGFVLYDYLPEKAFYVRINPGAYVAGLSDLKVSSVLEIRQEFKWSYRLLTHDIPDYAMRDGNRVAVFVHFIPSRKDVPWEEDFRKAGAILSENEFETEYTAVEISLEQLSELTALPYVKYIETVNPPAMPDNSTGRTLHRSNLLLPSQATIYDGSGIQVMLQDDGTVGPHIDYQGRIPFQNISFNNGDHGDHIAGTIMGAGNLDPLGMGMAPGASLHVYTANNYQGFGSISSHYATREIRISSTSYSDGCNAGYTSLARTMDQQSRMYRKLIHVFSAGNAGTDDCGYGAGPGWGNITGGHKAGKNVLAVGNVTYTDGLASSSSRGPAHDGRIKPEVVAKGTNVYSTTNPNLYTLKTGTSMACPGVSGTLAQLYQAFRELNNQAYPDGGLMKAILMNTAEDLGNPGPDFKFGFGRIDAGRALKVLTDFRYDSAMVSQGQSKQHIIEVPENVAQLRIMIYWTDYEGTIGTTKALVNDIDIHVTGTDATVYQPWVLNHLPPAANLNAPAERGTDSRNNVEQVTLDNPVAGNYILNVQGTLIPQGPQLYYVTWEFIPRAMDITYPSGGESFVPAEKETLRWNAPLTEESFRIEYSMNGGTDWIEIASTVPSAMRSYDWTVPNGISSQVFIRITNGEMQTVNPAPFTIMAQPTGLKIDWSCPDAFRMTWNEVYGAEGYIVSRLGDLYMDSVAFTEQNSYLFTGAGLDEQWVSVQAVGTDHSTSRRNKAINRPPGAFQCFTTDLEAKEIPSAEWTVYPDCHNLVAQPVDMIIQNITASPTAGFVMGFSLNGTLIESDTLSTMLAPDSSFQHLFTKTIDISIPGEYILKAWVSHEQDEDRTNDTIIKPIRVIGSNVIAGAYQQTFDGFARCQTVPVCELYTCEISDGWINLINNSEDQIDWRTYGGSTPSTTSGPSADHTTGTSQGNYLYLEPSVICLGKEAVLHSPCFDFTDYPDAVVRFWVHMWGEHTGRLHVDALTENGIQYDLIPPIIGDQGNAWKEIVISELPASLTTFRIRGITGPGQNSDIAIDDFEIGTGVGIAAPSVNTMNLNLFPNPSKGLYQLRYDQLGELRYNLKVTDLTGRIVFSAQTGVNLPGRAEYTLDLRHLPDGTYILQLESETQQQQIRIVKI